MIKFKTRIKGNRLLYFFGLSKLNIELLQQDRPIKFNLSEIGGEGEVIIFYGEDEQKMVEKLQEAGLIPNDKKSVTFKVSRN